MDIKILAKSSFAIIGVVAVLAMLGYLQSGNMSLLETAKEIAAMVIVGGVLIAFSIHALPQILKQL